MALRPPEVHPEEHLGPVGSFRAAGPGADREQCRAIVVLAGEQQRRALPLEVCGECLAIPIQFCNELRVIRLFDQLDQRLQLLGPAQQVTPQADFGFETVGLAQDLLRAAAVLPESWRECQGVELIDPRLFPREVKGAPRSSESAQPGPGRRWRPLGPDPEVLEQDRPKLDQPKS
jgi:hypothetical protein